MDRHARKGKPQHHRLGFAKKSARDQKPQCNPPGGANLRRPWGVCTSSTSSTHAELGTRSAHGPLALVKPPAANSTNNGRGSIPPLFLPVYQPAKSGRFAHCSKVAGPLFISFLFLFFVFFVFFVA